MGRTPSTTHRWLFCRALYLQPSDDKSGCGANSCCYALWLLTIKGGVLLIRFVLLKGFAFWGLFSGISGNTGIIGISGKSPIIPSVPIVPFINLRAKRTTLYTFHFSLFTFQFVWHGICLWWLYETCNFNSHNCFYGSVV